MRETQQNITHEAQPSDSEHQQNQDDRDVIARLLAKLLLKIWLKQGTSSEKFSETL